MKPQTFSPRAARAAVAALLCLAPVLANAAERYWIRNSGTAVFSSLPDNWSTTSGGVGGAGIPTQGDTANFDLTGTYTVILNVGPVAITNLDVEAGNVTFDLAGRTLLVANLTHIGVSFGQTTARLTLFGGLLDVDTSGDNIEIGTIDADGFLTVSTGAEIGDGASNPDIILGAFGDGTLTINNGGMVRSTSGQFGTMSALSTGTATVTGLGSAWINSGAFAIGSSGTGTLTVQSGGTISGNGSQIGSGGGSIGSVTVTGAGSSWTEASSLTIGNFGAGTLSISGGGQVSAASSAFIAGQGNSFGTVNVSGAGSQWTMGTGLTVGNLGQGTLALASGGQVNCTTLVIGDLNSSSTEGTVSITGAGSMLRATGAVDVGDDDLGFLTVANGGQLVTTAGADIGNASLGVGEVTVTGANASWSNTGTLNVAANGTGTLNVANGGAIINTGSLNINDPAGVLVGTLNFDGGSITTSNFTRAAGGGFNWTDGTLTLVNGIFNNASANLTINGGQAGDLPTLHLSGNSTGAGFGATTLTVGANRAGALQVTGLSTLSVASLVIGSADGGNGTVTVSGNAASLTTSGTLAVGGTQFNPGGTGTLNIGPGATVTTSDLRIWGGGTINLDGGFLQTFAFGSDVGTINFNSGTVHFTGIGYSGAYGSVYDTLLGFEHRLTSGKTIAYDGSFSFNGMNLIMEGGTLDVATGLTVGINSLLEMRSGTLDANALVNSAAGQVVLEGGSLTLLTTFNNSGDLRLAATTDFSLISGTALNNTGLIHGHGQIGMSLMNNSGGQVRVAATERMAFTGGSTNNGTGQIEVSAGGDLKFQSTLLNNSAIDVIGGTLRVQGVTTNTASTGRITGRDAVMRFDGGIVNNGSLAFSFGTSDIFGDITNSAAGRIVVSGNSDATFYGDLTNHGAVQVSVGSVAVYFGAVSGAGSFPGGGTNFFEGDLAPGASPALITFGGSVVFGAFNTLTMEIGGPVRGSGYDALDVAGSLSLSGNLNVVLVNGFIPSVGQSFKLLNAALLQGNFSSVTLPPLPAGRFWNTDLLATAGVLSVVGAPMLNYTNDGTSLGFSWSGAFKLQAQTNGLDVGISTNWGDFPGGGSSPVSVPIDVLRGSVFFRLSSP